MTRTIILILLFCTGIQGFAQEYTIKFATIAPEGTTWMNVMKEYDAAIRKESAGRLGFKIYPGGTQGEDKDVIRKIRLGQLHSAGFTGVGLGEIAPKVRILDSPFLFENYEEVDHVYAALDKEFSQEFIDRDFILLGWAEVGFVYVFTNTPIRTLADMSGVKMWMWESDPIAEATFKAFGIRPIPLSIVDVFTSLQTGLINGAYISPYAAIALQWNTRVKYMLSVPLADASGAVVVSKKKFDTLPPDLQEILQRNGRKFMRELTQKSRIENAAAIKTMEKNNITITDIASPKTRQEYAASGKVARHALVGKLYDKSFLDRVEETVSNFSRTPQYGQMIFLRSLDRLLIKIESAFLVVFLGTMIVLAFTQVVLRNFFDTGFLWGDTLVRHLVLWAGFTGAAIATSEERHISIDALTRFLSPRVKYVAQVLTNLFAIVVCCLLAQAALTFLSAEKEGGGTMVLSIPSWIGLIVIAPGYGLMALHFVLKLIESAVKASEISGEVA